MCICIFWSSLVLWSGMLSFVLQECRRLLENVQNLSGFLAESGIRLS